MRIATSLAALGLAATLLPPATAAAAPVNGTLDFMVSGFQTSDPAAPQDTLAGQVQLSFDTSTSVTNSTTGIASIALNLVPTTALAFSYNASQDILTIGGAGGGAGSLATTGQDFVLTVQNLFGGNGPLIVFGSYFIEPDAFISFDQAGTARLVPEPASMLLLGAGLLGLAAVRRRR
jgi:hypothetical protein